MSIYYVLLTYSQTLHLPAQKSKNIYLGDSWFGSVKAAEAVALSGNHAIFVVKMNHGRSPKAWLEEKMSNFPGGTWIVLQGQTRKHADLLCIGYKYNKSKVMVFVATTGAGSTVAGRPYQARFPDVFGNVHTCDVQIPALITRYYDYCGGVDAHNQARQGNLALEEAWVTQFPYFRIWTTILGMTVTDLWYVYRSKKHTYRQKSILEFADELSFVLLKKVEKKENKGSKTNVPKLSKYKLEITGTYEFCQSDLPKIISPQGEHRESQLRCGIHEKFHTKVNLGGKSEDKPHTRSKQCETKVPFGNQVRCISHVNHIDKRTRLWCKECRVGFCAPATGRMCWSLHVRNDGPPPSKRAHK